MENTGGSTTSEQIKDNPQVFNKVDTFVQRCQDMVEVCEAMAVFGR